MVWNFFPLSESVEFSHRWDYNQWKEKNKQKNIQLKWLTSSMTLTHCKMRLFAAQITIFRFVIGTLCQLLHFFSNFISNFNIQQMIWLKRMGDFVLFRNACLPIRIVYCCVSLCFFLSSLSLLLTITRDSVYLCGR